MDWVSCVLAVCVVSIFTQKLGQKLVLFRGKLSLTRAKRCHRGWPLADLMVPCRGGTVYIFHILLITVVMVVDPFSFGFKCRSFLPLLRPTTDLSPVVVSRRYLSICWKVISGRSSTAPYRSRNEQTSAKLGQSGGPELLSSTGAAIFPGGEKQEGRALLGCDCVRMK